MDKDPFIDVRNSSVVDIKRFIEKNSGTNVNDFRSKDGSTMLHIAADHTGNAEIVKILISKGADVYAKDDIGSTPLHYAKNAEIADVLISNRANINAKAKGGITPLHLAIFRGKMDVINVLISKGADIEAVEDNGHTPLHGAILCGNVEAAKVLIKKGANVYAKNIAGQTTLYLAKQKDDAAMLQYLSGITVMDEGFIDILKIIVEKHGKGPFLDIGICRGFIADYVKNEYKEESLCLFKAVEAGVSKTILGSNYNSLQFCMKRQHKKLIEEIGMDATKSKYIVNILGLVLWGIQFQGD
jgi:hypothetical protein